MVLQTQFVTAEQFDQFIRRPNPGDSIYELIGGEIVEVPTNPFASNLAARILGFLFIYLLKNPIGHIFGADGGFWVSGERYAPDVAYISKARQPELAREGHNPSPPELAVEVISDEKNAEELQNLLHKITNYLAAGTTVWVVYPFSQVIDVHAPGQPVNTSASTARWIAVIFCRSSSCRCGIYSSRKTKSTSSSAEWRRQSPL